MFLMNFSPEGFKRFKSVKEAASFAGLDPSPYESGSSVKKSGKIKKMGNPYARKDTIHGSIISNKV